MGTFNFKKVRFWNLDNELRNQSELQTEDFRLVGKDEGTTINYVAEALQTSTGRDSCAVTE